MMSALWKLMSQDWLEKRRNRSDEISDPAQNSRIEVRLDRQALTILKSLDSASVAMSLWSMQMITD
jgi:hypothetical protein